MAVAMGPRPHRRAPAAAAACSQAEARHQGDLLGPGHALPAAAPQTRASGIRPRVRCDDGLVRECHRHYVRAVAQTPALLPTPGPPTLSFSCLAVCFRSRTSRADRLSMMGCFAWEASRKVPTRRRSQRRFSDLARSRTVCHQIGQLHCTESNSRTIRRQKRPPRHQRWMD